MKFSIITAVRNGAATIADTITSVNSQTHPDVEHVFVDGMSTDGTLDLIHRLSTRRGPTIYGRDSGIYDAFNKGLSLATGDVICFLNADDFYCDRAALERVAAEFESSGADIVLADMVYFREGDRRRVRRFYSSAAFSPQLLRIGVMPGHAGMFVKRHVYESIKGFDTSYRIAGDFEFAVKAFIREKRSYVHLPKVVVAMRLGGVSTQGLRSNWTITQEVVRACRNNGVATAIPLAMCRLPLKLMELVRKPPHPVELSPA